MDIEQHYKNFFERVQQHTKHLLLFEHLFPAEVVSHGECFIMFCQKPQEAKNKQPLKNHSAFKKFPCTNAVGDFLRDKICQNKSYKKLHQKLYGPAFYREYTLNKLIDISLMARSNEALIRKILAHSSKEWLEWKCYPQYR